MKNDGAHEGGLDFSAAKALMPYPGSVELVYRDGCLFLVEPLCNEGTAFIFGAGHVSQKIAPLTRMVGFRTVVLDNRERIRQSRAF